MSGNDFGEADLDAAMRDRAEAIRRMIEKSRADALAEEERYLAELRAAKVSRRIRDWSSCAAQQ